MSKNKKTSRAFLTLFVVAITGIILINQFYISQKNNLLSLQVSSLSKTTNILKNENTNLKYSLDESHQTLQDKDITLETIVEENLSNSLMPINTNPIRNIETIVNKPADKEPIETELEEKVFVQHEPSITDIVKVEKTSAKTNEGAKVKTHNTSNNIQTNDKNIMNIMILGVNSALTDTILVASINKEKKDINIISIPRDYWVSNLKTKINSVYVKYGFDALRSSVEKILGLKIHKNVKLYFDGFEKIIDHLGGIWIYNETEIDDKRYPTKDYKYGMFKLTTGYHHLNGENALKFARTRHGDSDFKRSARQHEVINGIYNAIKRLDYTDINLILNMIKDLIKYVKTDIGTFESLQYIHDFKSYTLKTGNVIKAPTYLYSDRNYYGQYILLPRDPSLTHIHNYIRELTH